MKFFVNTKGAIPVTQGNWKLTPHATKKVSLTAKVISTNWPSTDGSSIAFPDFIESHIYKRRQFIVRVTINYL